jgi:rhodanese-related sulfurtransferase
MTAAMNLEITPKELAEMMKRGDKVRLIDVREPWEYELTRIEGSELIPMGDVPARLPELYRDEESRLVCICHYGQRSMSVADWLRRNGIEDAQSLAGGVEAWRREVDATIPGY